MPRLRPLALHHGADAASLLDAGRATPLLGGRIACSLFELIEVDTDGLRRSRYLAPDNPELAPWLAPFQWPRPPFFDRPRLMGILNVTPDSFSDGGRFVDLDAATAHALAMVEAGADIVDVGGESTRPGAREIPAEEELRRVVPVVERLVTAGVTVSIDTRKADVMRAATQAGASIVNDVSGLTFDPEAPSAAAASGAMVVLMHMRDTPAGMNKAPAYRHAALEIFDELAARIATAEAAGIARHRIIVDPGLCFAKHEPHNLDLLRHLAMYHGLGVPVALGASRKGWTARLHESWRPAQRLPASLAAAQWGLAQGIQLFRVHDVAEHRQMLDAWEDLCG
ncbi:MAG: dihydropteroate synthase [Geminicoccaceae bacterium]